MARGVVFATAPWLRGANAANAHVDYDERARAPGFVQGAIGGIYSQRDMGVTITAGGAVVPTWWTDPSIASLASPAAGALTISILWTPRTLDTTILRALLAKRTRPLSAPVGYSIECIIGGTTNPRWQTADAVGIDDVNDPNALALRHTYHTIARCAGISRNNEMYLYRDGTRVAYVFPGAPNPPAVNSLPVSFFGSSTGAAAQFSAEIGACVIWDRYLPDSAANMLTTDPFTLWRPLEPDEGDLNYWTFFNAF